MPAITRPMLLALTAIATSGADATAQNFARYEAGTQANGQYGQVVATLNDIDGDGGADYAIGAPLYDVANWPYAAKTDAGRVSIYNGRTGAAIRHHNGAAASHRFGSAISRAPDCDGDGKYDYAIGAPGVLSDTGRVLVYSSATGAEIWRFEYVVGPRLLGSSLACIADANNDGHEELLIGCKGLGTDNGFAYVRDRNNSLLFGIGGYEAGSRFGTAVARAPDLNGDGTFDFLVGAPLDDVTTPWATKTDAGVVYAYNGKTGALLSSFWEYESNAEFGTSIAVLLDTNSSGGLDFVVGAPAWSNHTGFVCVYDGNSGSKLIRLDSPTSNDEWFGQAVCSAGDWNSDGRGDFCVGIPGYTGAIGAIGVYSGYSGSSLFFVDAQNLSYPSGEGNGNYGSSLASGFFDNDWSYDLLIGDPAFVKSGSIRGSYHLIERY